MKKSRLQQQAGFSLDDFLESELKKKGTRELLAAVQQEADHLLIYPSPSTSGTVLRVRKSFAEVGEASIITCHDGTQKELHRIRIRRDAPCLRIEAGTAEELLDRLDPFGDIETRVKNAKIKFNEDGTGKAQLRKQDRAVPRQGRFCLQARHHQPGHGRLRKVRGEIQQRIPGHDVLGWTN